MRKAFTESADKQPPKPPTQKRAAARKLSKPPSSAPDVSEEQLALSLQARHRGNVARRGAPRPLYHSATPLVLTLHELRLSAQLRKDPSFRSIQASVQLATLPASVRRAACPAEASLIRRHCTVT